MTKLTDLSKTTEYRKDKHLESSRENLQAFFKEYDLVKKEKLEDGSYRLYVQKKRKCKNCVWWIELKPHPIAKILSGAMHSIIGACGDEDYHGEPDDTGFWKEKFVNGDDTCPNYRRRCRTIGGQPIDERRSIFLQKTFDRL